MAKKTDRDAVKAYPCADFVAKLRRIADAIENDKRFQISVAGERIYVPSRAVYNIEHERQGGHDELEFPITWDTE